MDESLRSAIHSLREVVDSLPQSISEILHLSFSALNLVAPSLALPTGSNRPKSQSSAPLVGFNFHFGDTLKKQGDLLGRIISDFGINLTKFKFPKLSMPNLNIDTATLSSDFGSLSRETVTLTRDFMGLGEKVRNIQFPKFGGVNFADTVKDFGKKVRDFIQPTIIRPYFGNTVPNLAPLKAGIGSVFRDVLSGLNAPKMKQIPYKPGVTVQIPHSFHTGNPSAALQGFASNFTGMARGILATIPPLLVSAYTKARDVASGIIGGGGGIIGGLASFARLASFPGALLGITHQVENLREQALAANSRNVKFSAYSGELFREQMLFNLGNFSRTRTIAQQTQGSASELARNVNQMEQAFLPFDVMTADLSNKFGQFKAGIARGFAENFLTPIANAYNSPVWQHLREGFKASATNTILGSIGVVGAGALAGFAVGGPIGAAVGAAAAGLGLTSFLNPNNSGSILGGAIGGALWGAGIGAGIGSFIPVIGTGIGALIGGIGGAIYGGVTAALKPDEAVQVQQGPWFQFLKDANNRRPLRPPQNVRPVPNRWHP